ncbi:PTS glucose transporter subunit IIA [Alicyclobacillus fastidiosus]|uniref:PTS glucose transporter subunit IIA n=1 Tax=Alicyclobacillus fastidiosus TaxID=392011 RepID=A0ABY6ZGV0_9BACL|nr:PTS glucose transporter subunit IIA [Alicyclobacillus fastidiosus]WAH42092.1 PTS glucose transporter subunit IIA [Alicyclobacillus fastidiosus]GMA63859.1 PTS glucose transporter subunit IIA [Alicyclobacillus fastidiosus]
MFKNLFKRTPSEERADAREIIVLAPVDGDILPLEAVDDPVFAQKMIGDGLAILPTSDTVVAPVAGTLTQLFPTGHAAGITTPEGIEVLIHVGMDTVELKGEGFTKLAEQGMQVEVGTPLIRLDLDKLQTTAKSLVTPVVITNMQKVEHLSKADAAPARAGDSWLLKVETRMTK